MNKKKRKVLIAEDDRDVMLVLETGLEEYDIIQAYNGREAYGKIKEEAPDLILLDIMMPEINGAELNKKLKKEDSLKNIPVIIITGRPNMEGLFSKAGENKVDGFLEKPFTLEVLKKSIRSILS